MTVLGYVRVSDSKGSEVSPERQWALVLDYCARAGLGLPERFYDKDKSGSDPGRPAWQQLLAQCRDGGVRAVVAYSQDRLFRSEGEAAAFLGLVKREGLEVHFADSGRLDLVGADAQTMFHFQAVLHAHVVRKTSERTQVAMNYKRTRGEKLGGSVPYGYRVELRGETKLLVPDPEEQRVLAYMLELRAAGDGYQVIAGKLQAAGVRSKTGRTWWLKGTVHQVLRRAEKRGAGGKD